MTQLRVRPDDKTNSSRELGYKPFPQPSGNMWQAYLNPLGIRVAPCTYCGFCEWFGCANYSKASLQTTILPALVRNERRNRRRAIQAFASESKIT